MTAAFSSSGMTVDPALLASDARAPLPSSRMPDEAWLLMLRGTSAALTRTSAPIEQAMFSVGERLSSAVGGLSQVTEAFERMPVKLGNPEVRAASARLEEVATALTGIADALSEERSALDGLAGMAHQVGRRAEKLHRTVAAVGVLAINARIEAAHLKADQEDFTVFTVEIGRLARVSGDAVQRFIEEFDRLEKLLLAASAHQCEFARSCAPQLRNAAQRLQESLNQVADHRLSAAQTAQEIGVRSRRIGEGIASSVHALQIGDITRQRIEHVTHAVGVLAQAISRDDGGDAAASPDALDGWCAALPEDQQAMVMAAVCRLQSAQVLHAVGDFGHEVTALVQTLRDLADNASGIVQMGREHYGAARGRQSFLTNLTKDIGVAETLIGVSQKARQEVDDVAAAAERTLADLVTRIEAIRAVEMDMRLVGLNTALKCGRLGKEGRTLSVIAQELRGYANATVEDAQSVMTGLRDVVAMAEALQRRGAAQSAARIAGLERVVAEAIATLHATDRGLSHALATLEREGDRVAGLLAETATGITMHRDLERGCRDAARRLDEVAAACHVTDEDLEAVRDKVLALLHGHYTMASERTIHDLLFGLDDVRGDETCANGGVGLQPSADMEASLDDIFF